MMTLHSACRSRLFSSKASLSSFLAQPHVNPNSTVYRGTLFELQTLSCFTDKLDMDLVHVGGKSDRGIDLRGQWINNINVLVQCKNTKLGPTPDHIRQLIGTVMSCTSSIKNTIGILSCAAVTGDRKFTRDVIAHFNASPVPLGLATVQDQILTTLMFNKRAQTILKGLVVSTEYNKDGTESLYIQLENKTSHILK